MSRMTGFGGTATRGDGVVRFDFRRPSKFGRELVRNLENLHESFARRFASLLTHSLRAVVQLRLVAVEEITYENYTRSLPNPSLLALVSLSPLPGNVILETSAQMGLVLVDRVLGGVGAPAGLRRPTELETKLIGEVLGYGLEGFAETFAPITEVTPAIVGVESNPMFLQAASPSETTLLLSYAFSLQASAATEGLLTLCYPFSTLHPVLERLQRHAAAGLPRAHAESEADRALMEGHLGDVPVSISVRMKPTTVSALDVAGLRPGDVLRLEHRVDEAVCGIVEGVGLIDGHLGRRGKRLGLRFGSWRSHFGRTTD